MLQVSDIRDRKEVIIKGLLKKFYSTAEADIETVLATDDKRKALQIQLDGVLSEANGMAKSIGGLMKEGKKEEAETAKIKAGALREESNALKAQMNEVDAALRSALLQIPNIANENVPEGRTDEDNEIIFTSDKQVELPDSAVPHWDLIKKYDIIDFELGNKITGAGFPIYKGKGAKLQRGLINFFLDQATEAGYEEVIPPLLVNEDSALGTGQLPDKDGQMYHATEDNLFLIPTAEVPITNIYRDVILKPADLPKKNCGYTPCFRREAGSWGADVRGLNRLHQFDKVEIVQVSLPEKSYEILEEMKSHVESLLQKLDLPYRTLNLCGGDVSVAAAQTFDFEVYSAAQKRWLEVSSVSNFESFQANRLKLRYKDENNKSKLLHTLNGSALALPRIVASILENNQTSDGIKIPEVLVPYVGFEYIGK